MMWTFPTSTLKIVRWCWTSSINNLYIFMSRSAFSLPLGFSRASSPAFQREWQSLQSSAVDISDLGINATRDITLSPSSTQASGTVYVWGFSLVTTFATIAAAGCAGLIEDEDGKEYYGAAATNAGPFMIAWDAPVKITQNSKVIYRAKTNHSSGGNISIITLYYTVATEEVPY